MTEITDAMVEAGARSDAEFDGRPFDRLSRADRNRYCERARKSIAAALAAQWQPIENAPKEPNLDLLLSRRDIDGSEWVAIGSWWVNEFAFFYSAGATPPVRLCFEPTHWMYAPPLKGE